MASYYGKRFYEYNKQTVEQSADIVMKDILDFLHPTSIIDFGCGSGTWLGAVHKFAPAIKILGIDGDWVDKNILCFPAENFISCDLKKNVNIHELGGGRVQQI